MNLQGLEVRQVKDGLGVVYRKLERRHAYRDGEPVDVIVLGYRNAAVLGLVDQNIEQLTENVALIASVEKFYNGLDLVESDHATEIPRVEATLMNFTEAEIRGITQMTNLGLDRHGKTKLELIPVFITKRYLTKGIAQVQHERITLSPTE